MYSIIITIHIARYLFRMRNQAFRKIINNSTICHNPQYVKLSDIFLIILMFICIEWRYSYPLEEDSSNPLDDQIRISLLPDTGGRQLIEGVYFSNLLPIGLIEHKSISHQFFGS